MLNTYTETAQTFDPRSLNIISTSVISPYSYISQYRPTVISSSETMQPDSLNQVIIIQMTCESTIQLYWQRHLWGYRSRIWTLNP